MEPHEKQVKWKWAWKCWRDQGQCKFRGWWSRLESSNHALSSVYVSFSSVFNVSLLGNQELYSHSLNMHSTCIHSCCASICRQSNSLSHTHTDLHKVKDRHSHTYIPYTSTLTYTLCYINGHCHQIFSILASTYGLDVSPPTIYNLITIGHTYTICHYIRFILCYDRL